MNKNGSRLLDNNILRIFCIFLFTGFSLHIFIFDLKLYDSNFLGVNNPVYSFYLNLWLSMNSFDIIWLILGIFIFDFFNQIYFVEGVWKINKLIIAFISAIISIIILIVFSLYVYNDLRVLCASFVQIYKCLMVGIGYYFIIYSILKRLFFVKKIDE